MASKMCLSLNTGAKMPVLGLGTWKSSVSEVKAAVEAAIDCGYRHIDCACLYKNEAAVGEAIKTKIEQGVVKREDLFITTKLWSTRFRKVRESFRESLQLLQLDYVDLYLVHMPMGLQHVSDDDLFPVDEQGKGKLDEDIHYGEVYKEVEKIFKEGLAKAIGISNFNVLQIEKLINRCEVKPAVHQYEMHPYLDQENLLQFCLSKGIAVTGYSPFGSPDRPWHASTDPSDLLSRPDLKNLAEKHGKTVAQVLLRYQLQRGVSIVPKSVTPSRIQDNAKIFDFQLDEEDMKNIKKLDCNWRVVDPPIFHGHKYNPFTNDYSE